MNASAKISKLREILGLDQLEMAKMLGVSRNYVSMIERGREPSETLNMLVDSLWRKHVGEAENPTESDFPSPAKNATEWHFPGSKASGDVLQEPLGQGRDLLRRAREAKGMTQSQLAASVGYSLAVYQEIEEGRSQMGQKMAARVAKALGLDVADLLGGSDHPHSNGTHFGTVGAIPPVQLPPGSKARYVPLLSMAQCGAMGAYDDAAYDHTGFLAIDPKDGKAFSVKLTGDSMTPVLAPGDIAVVYPSCPPKNGKIVIARLNDDHGGDVMVKLYQATASDVTLSSYNPAYPPITYPREAFSWIYPIASVTKVFE